MSEYIKKKTKVTPMQGVVVDDMSIDSSVNAPSINAVKGALYNPNLLINGDFKVNQRGQTTYNGVSNGFNYTIDRWALYINSKLTLIPTNYGLTINGANGNVGDFYKIRQVIDNVYLRSSNITLSIKTLDNYYNYTFSNFKDIDEYVNLNNKFQVYLTYNTSTKNLNFRICILENTTIEFIKLELGSLATPFVPRPYSEELAMCQRYYKIVYCSNSFTAASTTMAYLCSYNIYPMVSGPTIQKVSDGTLSNVSRLSYKAFTDRLEISAYATTDGFLRYQNTKFILDSELY